MTGPIMPGSEPAARTFSRGAKDVQQKLPFGAWRVSNTPVEIRERYRQRFGIEASLRRRRQARIDTCTRNPHLRLVFIALALITRNLRVWIHATHRADSPGEPVQPGLERFRFKRLLDWTGPAAVVVGSDAATTGLLSN